jgi:hypothetical protein
MCLFLEHEEAFDAAPGVIVCGVLAEPLAMWARGYPIGGNLIVRCRHGHLFTTLWVPSASVKALLAASPLRSLHD